MQNYDLTPRRRENLLKLANYLEKLPRNYQHFEMADFIDRNGEYDLDERIAEYARHNGGVDKCGTVACAVGHGPAAGILFPPRAERFWERGRPNWVRYTLEFFLGGDTTSTPEFNWMFGGDWTKVDNHHYGAAARIRYVLADRPLPKRYGRWTEPKQSDRRLYAEFRKGSKARALVSA